MGSHLPPEQLREVYYAYFFQSAQFYPEQSGKLSEISLKPFV
jgi:hypothetical protein